MKNLLEFLLNHLVDHPESVVVEEITDEEGKLYRFKVHPEDIGRVIGKQGKIIKALRKIAQIRLVHDGEWAHIVLDSDDSDNSVSETAQMPEVGDGAVIEDKVA